MHINNHGSSGLSTTRGMIQVIWLVGLLWSMLLWVLADPNVVPENSPKNSPQKADTPGNPLLHELLLEFSSRDFFLPTTQNEEVDLGPIDRNINGKQSVLNDFAPISNRISQSQIQQYLFAVNTTGGGVGEYYELLIFLSGNICLQPNELPNNASLTVYYSFNSSLFTDLAVGQMVHFLNGYFQALADVPVYGNAKVEDTILYIAVQAPENTNNSASWNYEIGVSQSDLVFQWDDRAWASVVDTDQSSALIVTGNITNRNPGIGNNITLINSTDLKYELFIYLSEYKDYFNALNSSWCAIRNGPSLFPGKQFETLFTNRSGSLQQQFYVDALNELTTYIAYLLSDFGGSDFGGAVYQPFEFTTLSNPICELVYNLEFCSKVAYSVPSDGLGATSKELLAQLYDLQAASLYTNFSKALQQIACNTTDDAIFSPVVGCKNCAEAYKDWLCSITIPRCLTRNQTGYMLREVNQSRNDFINTVIQPQVDYYEILPCVNTCYSIARTCPQQFGFICPTKNESIQLSYYWDGDGEYVSCNFMGTHKSTSWAIKMSVNSWWLVFLALVYML